MTRRALVKWSRLAGMCVIGLASVSVPVTIALVLGATGSSDLLIIDEVQAATHERPRAEAVVGRCKATEGHYALTFEGGPLPARTRAVVAALRKAGAPATFFDLGERAAAHPELVDVQRTAGTLANGGYTGVRLTTVSSERRVQELTATARVLEHPNALFRPAHDDSNAEVDADVRRSGLTTIGWTVDADTGAGRTTDIVRAARRLKPGGVLRLREGDAHTAAAIPALVAALKTRGLCPGAVTPTGAVKP